MKEIVIPTGLPAAGKSTIVNEYISRGFEKLSRDEIGGGLEADGLVNVKLKNWIKMGKEKIIMDGTYMTEDVRKHVIDIAKANGYLVNSVYLATTIEDAQFNAVSRMVNRHGKLFMKADDYKNSKDPNMFPPAALYKAKKVITKPSSNEGFDHITVVPFKRKPNGYTNKAILFDYDGTLRVTKSGGIYPTNPDDIVALPGRTEKINELKAQGYIILGVSNQSGVAKGALTYEMAEACFKKTNELLGVDIDFRFCSHSVPPITCYCRKPGVGFGVEFIEKYKLDPSQCIMVGDMTSDETFAKRCGFKYVHVDKFFK
jgi:D-glycero-D-manno-heptose 1,7-bisphosphate phosphatase